MKTRKLRFENMESRQMLSATFHVAPAFVGPHSAVLAMPSKTVTATITSATPISAPQNTGASLASLDARIATSQQQISNALKNLPAIATILATAMPAPQKPATATVKNQAPSAPLSVSAVVQANETAARAIQSNIDAMKQRASAAEEMYKNSTLNLSALFGTILA